MRNPFILACLLSAACALADMRYPALIESLTVSNGTAIVRVYKHSVDSAPFIESADTPCGPWSKPAQYVYSDGFYWFIVTQATSPKAFYRAWRNSRVGF